MAWSISKAHDFEKCKKFFELKHIQRIPEPERPLPPGKTEHANDRGTRVHQSCEDYVTGKIHQLAPEAELYFGPQIDLLRTMYKDGIVSLEGEWGYKRDWSVGSWGGEWVALNEPPEPGIDFTVARKLPERGKVGDIVRTGTAKKPVYWIWESAWLRMKLDVIVFHDEKTATVIDHKTGRKFGNEVKHGEQLQLYQLGAFARYPQLETVYAELWYLDQNEVTSQRFTRKQGLRFKSGFERRGDAIEICSDFPPNPSVFTCKWCQYGPWNGGQCAVGVQASKR